MPHPERLLGRVSYPFAGMTFVRLTQLAGLYSLRVKTYNNAAEVTKHFCCWKAENVLYHSTIVQNILFRLQEPPRLSKIEGHVQRQIRWVALGEYQVSLTSYNPVQFITFATSVETSGELGLTISNYYKPYPISIYLYLYIYIYINLCVCVCVCACVCVHFDSRLSFRYVW